jgi:hypothetical protein
MLVAFQGHGHSGFQSSCRHQECVLFERNSKDAAAVLVLRDAQHYPSVLSEHVGRVCVCRRLEFIRRGVAAAVRLAAGPPLLAVELQ